MINSFLGTFADAITANPYFAPFICLLAGILTSLTPCSLSTIPLVITYVGGSGTQDIKKAFKLSATFVGGMAITYTLLGALAAVAGRLIGSANRCFYIFLGVLMVMMALQTWEIFTFIPPTYLNAKSTRRGYAGALASGILGGIFSSACATPVLVVLLSLVARSESPVKGIIYLLLFSIGNGFLVVVAGTSIGMVRKISISQAYGRFSSILKLLTGMVILLIGFYMFYLGF